MAGEILAASAATGIMVLYFGLVVLGIADLVLSVWGAISVLLSSKSKMNKLIWILVLAFIPFGGFIWYFIDKRN